MNLRMISSVPWTLQSCAVSFTSLLCNFTVLVHSQRSHSTMFSCSRQLFLAKKLQKLHSRRLADEHSGALCLCSARFRVGRDQKTELKEWMLEWHWSEGLQTNDNVTNKVGCVNKKRFSNKSATWSNVNVLKTFFCWPKIISYFRVKETIIATTIT